MCVKEYSEVKNMKESIQPKYHDVVFSAPAARSSFAVPPKTLTSLK